MCTTPSILVTTIRRSNDCEGVVNNNDTTTTPEYDDDSSSIIIKGHHHPVVVSDTVDDDDDVTAISSEEEGIIIIAEEEEEDHVKGLSSHLVCTDTCTKQKKKKTKTKSTVHFPTDEKQLRKIYHVRNVKQYYYNEEEEKGSQGDDDDLLAYWCTKSEILKYKRNASRTQFERKLTKYGTGGCSSTAAKSGGFNRLFSNLGRFGKQKCKCLRGLEQHTSIAILLRRNAKQARHAVFLEQEKQRRNSSSNSNEAATKAATATTQEDDGTTDTINNTNTKSKKTNNNKVKFVFDDIAIAKAYTRTTTSSTDRPTIINLHQARINGIVSFRFVYSKQDGLPFLV